MTNKPTGILEHVNYSNDLSIILYVNDTPENYVPHWHPAIEVIMPLENTYDIVIDNTIYHLEEEDIIVIPAGTLHELRAPTKGSRLILLIDHTLITTLKGMSSMLPILREPRLLKRTDLDQEETHDNATQLLLNIMNEYNHNEPLWEIAIYAKLIQLFLLIGRKYFNSNLVFHEMKQNKQREYIEKFDIIFDYIHNNYTKEITLDSIAEIAGFSKFHFSRLFKQFTNMSFYDYLNKERIQVAETLLLNPELSITEVAFLSGYSSISTFNRVFKSNKKSTPTEFRALYQIK